MDDDDLAQIRAARLQELQGKQGGGGGGGDKQQQEDEARRGLISQICTPEAVDRLGRIAMVKESRARELEMRLVMLARSGQLRERVTEEKLIEFMRTLDKQKEAAGGSGGGGGSGGEIKFQRRKGAWDDDDDDLLDL